MIRFNVASLVFQHTEETSNIHLESRNTFVFTYFIRLEGMAVSKVP